MFRDPLKNKTCDLCPTPATHFADISVPVLKFFRRQVFKSYACGKHKRWLQVRIRLTLAREGYDVRFHPPLDV